MTNNLALESFLQSIASLTLQARLSYKILLELRPSFKAAQFIYSRSRCGAIKFFKNIPYSTKLASLRDKTLQPTSKLSIECSSLLQSAILSSAGISQKCGDCPSKESLRPCNSSSLRTSRLSSTCLLSYSTSTGSLVT